MKARVLIVDDSITSTHIFKMVLEKENHTVFTSYDALNIFQIIEENSIDIILLDVIMPNVNGYEILQLLQGSDKTRDIPVIMITSLTSPMDVKKALDYGALDCIRKPSEPIEVIARLNSALRLKVKQDLLKGFAQKDALTQIYNRRYFNNVLEEMCGRKGDFINGICLIMCDCDFFKRINDCYGHTSGDDVLVAVANALSKSVKSTDTVCRYGGEEFAIVLPNTTVFQAYVIAERIRSNIQKIPFVFKNQKVTVTISCGLSHSKEGDEKNSMTLVSEADLALYCAKERGRNQTQIFKEIKEPETTGHDESYFMYGI